MKRSEQLEKLSAEHRAAIKMAEDIYRIAEKGSEAELEKGVKMVKDYNDREFEAHLQNEEQTILAPLVQYEEYRELCVTLGQEHGFMRTLVEDMNFETARKDLTDFAVMLKNHTLVEEKELFPIVESVFTEEQLNSVSGFFKRF